MYASQVMFCKSKVMFVAQMTFAFGKMRICEIYNKKTGVKGVKKQVMAKKAQVI